MFLAKDHQVAFPMAELGAIVRGFRPEPDPGGVGEHETSRLARAPPATLAAAFRQMAGQILALAGGRVDLGMDGLVAKPVPNACSTLSRPAICSGDQPLPQPIDHRRAQLRVPRELALSGTASDRELPRRHRPVAVGSRDLPVMPPVAPDLAMDRRAMPTPKLPRYLRPVPCDAEAARCADAHPGSVRQTSGVWFLLEYLENSRLSQPKIESTPAH